MTQIQEPKIQPPAQKAPIPKTAGSKTKDQLKILPWRDSITDISGYDPRSAYVEMFWLPILGPSCIWLMRRLAIWLDKYPDGFEISAVSLARELGIGVRPNAHSSRISPIRKSLIRCSDFGITYFQDDSQPGSSCIYVKKRFPRISDRLQGKLNDRLKRAHKLWISAERKAKSETNGTTEKNGRDEMLEGYLAISAF